MQRFGFIFFCNPAARLTVEPRKTQHMEDLIKKLVEDKGKQDDTIDLFAYERGLKDAIAALSDRPLTVIVPTIQWGEWEDLHTIVEIKWSKCKGYKLSRIGKSVIVQAFEGDDDFDYPIKQTRTTEYEAMDACQEHKQAQVNAALEGCNVVPYHDPQPLLDALDYTANTEGVDYTRYIGAAKSRAKAALKTWEEAGLK